MKLLTQTIDAYNAIKPEAVLDYLGQNGWSKREDFSERAQIWIYPTGQEDQYYEVLLPVTTEIPDYASRMHDVFRVLELAEARPQTEIFNDLVDVGIIAKDKQREILNLHFYFDSTNSLASKFEASAKHLGAILESLQLLFDAIGQSKAGRASPFGKISKEITDRTHLSVLETFRGSFGLRLGIAPQPPVQQLNLQLGDLLNNQPLAELVAQEFIEILQQSQADCWEQLRDQLTQLQKRTVSNYRKFLLSIVDANSDLLVDWGSLNPEQGGSAKISAFEASRIVELIQQMEPEVLQEYEITGELLATNKTNSTFKLLDTSNRTPLSGKIAEEVLQAEDVELTIGKLYVATLREKISVSSITGEGQVERTLIHIYPLSVKLL